MSGTSPMNTPDAPLNWDAASVELPPMPMIPPGEDAMSATIAGVLPTLTAPLMASVAALQAKETMFSGKVVAADSAYQDADDSGGQSVGQLTSMLGQLGQMGQQAGSGAGGAGGGLGSFGQIMQQAMQAAQGGAGSQTGGGSQGGGAQPSAGQGPSGGGTPQQQPRDDASADDRDRESEKDGKYERVPLDAAGPGSSQPSDGAVPVAPELPHDGSGDLSRRM